MRLETRAHVGAGTGMGMYVCVARRGERSREGGPERKEGVQGERRERRERIG